MCIIWKRTGQTYGYDVDERRLAGVLETHERQLHLFLPEEALEPLDDSVDEPQHLGLSKCDSISSESLRLITPTPTLALDMCMRRITTLSRRRRRSSGLRSGPKKSVRNRHLPIIHVT